MIESATFYTLTCDSCGERMELSDEGSYLVVESLAEADEAIRDRDWRKVDGDGRLECLSCFEERDQACRVHECPTCGAPPSKPCNAPAEGFGSAFCCDARLALEPPAHNPEPRS